MVRPLPMFVIIPAVDYIVGSDTDNPPDGALAWLR